MSTSLLAPTFLINSPHSVEYQDAQTEFVLENLDLSTMRVNPSHIRLSNLANLDIITDEFGEIRSLMSMGTRINARGIGLSVNRLSFWYRDKTATYGPSDYSGRISNFYIPPQGVDLDIQFRLIPANRGTSSSVEREQRNAFHIFDRVVVSIVDGENMDFDIEDCNHTVLLSLFKPIFTTRLREALERTLSYLIRAIFEGADGVAWEVFRTTQDYLWKGMGFRSSVGAALSDEWDHLKHAAHDNPEEIGTTWTSSGVVVKLIDPETTFPYSFACGSEPQILGPEKKGPSGASSTATTQAQTPTSAGPAPARLFGSVLGSISGYALGTQDLSGGVNGVTKEQAAQLTFRQAVDVKAELERKRDGWESEAFDI